MAQSAHVRMSLESQTNNLLWSPPSSHSHNRSKTTGKPLRSSPLAGPAFSNNRSIVSLNETLDALQASSSPSIAQDPDQLLSVCSKSFIGPSQPASMVYMNSLSTQPCSSMDRLSALSPTPSIRSSQTDMRTIKRPPSAMYAPTETINIPNFELGLQSTPQTSCGIVSGSNFVSGSSRSRSRASYMSTASAGPSICPVSVVLEVEAEEVADAETDDTPPQVSAPSSHPNAKPKRTVPVDNSWYIANPYSVTPKFSRLGLAGWNVVMPVSAKEHRKRLSRAGSAPSFRSNTSRSAASTSSAHTKGNRSAGTSLRISSTTSSSTTSKQKEMRKSGHRDAVSSANSNEEHPTARTPKSEWLQIPPVHIPSHRKIRTREDLVSLSMTSSSSNRTSTFSSAASSPSGLPMPTPHTCASLAPSVVSYATACTSVGESEETVKQDHYQYQHPKGVSPTGLESGLVKRRSMLARMKSWRPSQSRQPKQAISDAGHSPNGSGGKHQVLSVDSEVGPSTADESVERGRVVVDFEPSLPLRTNEIVASVDIVMTSLPKSRSESAVQGLPSNEKRQRRTGSLRRMWNTLTWRTGL